VCVLVRVCVSFFFFFLRRFPLENEKFSLTTFAKIKVDFFC
jgi:hypothetical protein